MADDRWSDTAIDGVLFSHSGAFADERGSFREVWRARQTTMLGEEFVQANLSISRAGVLRGMHFHRRQVDLWFVVDGAVLTATTDLRLVTSGSNRAPHSQVTELLAGDALLIPRLVAHGFWAREETRLLYLVTNEYDGSDEHGFAWNDPLAAIPWPAGSPVLSARDHANPDLTTVVQALREEEDQKSAG